MSHGPWTFGSFVLDAAGFRLLNSSRPVQLERLALELLLMVVERHGELVSRGEIAARLWHADTEVDTEAGLHTVVRKLRAALGDSAERPVFFETVPGKGYRFVAAVSPTVTIAVLPFEDASGGTADEHLIDGLTEELIGALGAMAPGGAPAGSSVADCDDACPDARSPAGVARGLRSVAGGSRGRATGDGRHDRPASGRRLAVSGRIGGRNANARS